MQNGGLRNVLKETAGLIHMYRPVLKRMFANYRAQTEHRDG